MRIPSRAVRYFCEDLRDYGRVAPRGQAAQPLLRIGKFGKGRNHRRRGAPGRPRAISCRAMAVESEALWPARLCANHATGDSGSHVDGTWIPNCARQLLREYSGYAPQMTDAEFDSYASAYDDALTKGIAVSGEDKTYFAEHRLRWLARSLRERGCRPKRVLDF